MYSMSRFPPHDCAHKTVYGFDAANNFTVLLSGTDNREAESLQTVVGTQGESGIATTADRVTLSIHPN